MGYIDLYLEELQQDKLRETESKPQAPRVQQTRPDSSQQCPPEHKRLEEMTLEELRQIDYRWCLRSKLLGEDLYLVTNESVAERVRHHGLVCYTLDEALKLKGRSQEVIKRVHLIKKVFPGTTVLGESGEGKDACASQVEELVQAFSGIKTECEPLSKPEGEERQAVEATG